MAQLNDGNVVKYIQVGLKHALSKVLTEQLVQEEVSRYEQEVRAKIKPLVEGIIVESVQTMNDVNTIATHLDVYVRWLEDKSERT